MERQSGGMDVKRSGAKLGGGDVLPWPRPRPAPESMDLRKTGIHPDHWYPLARSKELKPGKTLGLDGTELYSIGGIAGDLKPGKRLTVRAVPASDKQKEKAFTVVARIDTPVELDYYRHGGILQFVLRQLLETKG